MGGIFISYRRDDTSGYAGRLADDLRDQFGKRRVFMDIYSLSPGQNYERHIAALLT